MCWSIACTARRWRRALRHPRGVVGRPPDEACALVKEINPWFRPRVSPPRPSGLQHTTVLRPRQARSAPRRAHTHHPLVAAHAESVGGSSSSPPPSAVRHHCRLAQSVAADLYRGLAAAARAAADAVARVGSGCAHLSDGQTRAPVSGGRSRPPHPPLTGLLAAATVGERWCRQSGPVRWLQVRREGDEHRERRRAGKLAEVGR
jgi:hypothetical protein